MKRLLAVAAIALTLSLPSLAWADGGPILAAAGNALQDSSVYVAPNANPSLTTDEVGKLKALISAGRHPMFVAVLPLAVKNEVGSPSRLVPGLIAYTRLSGVYAALAGPVFRGGESATGGVPNAANLAQEAYNQHRAEGPYATLEAFVRSVEIAPVLAQGVSKQPDKPFPLLAVLLPIALMLVGGIGFLLWRARRRNSEEFARRQNEVNGRIAASQARINGLSVTDSDQSNLNAAVELITSAREAANSAATVADLDNADGLRQQADQAYQEVTLGKTESSVKTTSRKKKGTTVSAPPKKAKPQQAPSQPNRWHSGYSGPPVANCYPGTGYGYYPGYGWGYYGYNGDFVTGMLVGEMLSGDDDDRGYDNDSDNDSSQPVSVDTGGGGGWSTDPGDSSYDSGGGGGWDSRSSDSGSSSSDSSDSGWGSSSSSSDSGGGSFDFGGGGDSGGGGGDSGGGGDW